jgi:hypothetical protein
VFVARGEVDGARRSSNSGLFPFPPTIASHADEAKAEQRDGCRFGSIRADCIDRNLIDAEVVADRRRSQVVEYQRGGGVGS